jgi:hypothetical protein
MVYGFGHSMERLFNFHVRNVNFQHSIRLESPATENRADTSSPSIHLERLEKLISSTTATWDRHFFDLVLTNKLFATKLVWRENWNGNGSSIPNYDGKINRN